MSIYPVIATALLAALLYAIKHKTPLPKPAAYILAAVMALSIGFGLVPGFTPITIGSVHINSGKLVMAVLLATLLPSHWAWTRHTTLLLVLALATLPTAAILLGFATPNPAISMALIWFAFGNLPSCIAEDFFFRRFVQEHLARFGRINEIAITALLFGLVHVGGGWLFALLAFIAGIFYSLAYRQSNNSVWAVVAIHWALNICRALIFGPP